MLLGLCAGIAYALSRGMCTADTCPNAEQIRNVARARTRRVEWVAIAQRLHSADLAGIQGDVAAILALEASCQEQRETIGQAARRIRLSAWDVALDAGPARTVPSMPATVHVVG